MRLLLLSNSTNYGTSYLEHCASEIDDFLGAQREVLLIPYAAVTVSYSAYEEMAQAALGVFGIRVRSIHHAKDPVQAVLQAEAIAVAGGNTFRLLQQLYENALLEPIREQCKAGMPYIGWSAGSNVAGDSICTTNDMPIVQPQSFDALGLVNVQINPHYTDRVILDHNGESRAQRLAEYVELNPDSVVLALPEGSWLRLDGEDLTYSGSEKLVVVQRGQENKYLNQTDAPIFLNSIRNRFSHA